MHINKNYQNISETYLFSEIAAKVKKFTEDHHEKDIIRMGIGDVSRPLTACAVEALKKASEEMGRSETFKGYGPEQGYAFLRQTIADYYKREHKLDLDIDEIFISDGAKSDIGNLPDIFSDDNKIAIADPVYPVYADSNIMAGKEIIYLKACADNDFLPMPTRDLDADIIYLCSPDNPTGAAYSRKQLKEWVDFANAKDALILFDAAYEAFVQDPEVARSIYEIEGAKSCAIEVCSLSKTCGFTGLRCGYTIVPKDLKRDGQSLRKMWLRRQTTKFNGVSYPVQRAAAACLSEEGMEEVRNNIDYYRFNCDRMISALDDIGWDYCGAYNSPYVWLRCPEGLTSREFFDELLTRAGVVSTPGSGFGENGEGYIRLTAFNTHGNTIEAMRRMTEIYKKDDEEERQ